MADKFDFESFHKRFVASSDVHEFLREEKKLWRKNQTKKVEKKSPSKDQSKNR